MSVFFIFILRERRRASSKRLKVNSVRDKKYENHLIVISIFQMITLKKQKKHLFLQKNQLTMNNFRKKMVYLQCCSKQAADMLRKQPCLVRTENLDNSLYTRTKTEVVHPIVYYCIHSASAGWVSTYTHWCELIFILCVQVVQNLQNRMKLVRTFFVPKNEITKK